MVLVAIGMLPGCGLRQPAGPPSLARDLAADLGQAEQRPGGSPFVVAPVDVAGETRLAIATPGQSRLTWEQYFPDGAMLQVAVALKPDAWSMNGDGVLFRIGVSDGRIHEDVVTRLVNPHGQPEDRRWIPLDVDLKPYSGAKWSLFYHPRYVKWRLVFNTNAGLPGSSDTTGDLPLWGEPKILGRR